MLQNGATYIWDNEMKVPYAVHGDQWIGFDDERSIREKMRYIKNNGFGGAMVWTIDMDDFKGSVCGGDVKFPLIGAMRYILDVPCLHLVHDLLFFLGRNFLGYPEERTPKTSIGQ